MVPVILTPDFGDEVVTTFISWSLLLELPMLSASSSS
jgi:hypothetical protein